MFLTSPALQLKHASNAPNPHANNEEKKKVEHIMSSVDLKVGCHRKEPRQQSVKHCNRFAGAQRTLLHL